MDELIKLFPCDGLSSVASDGVDYLNKLVIIVAILKLFINVSEIVEIQFSFTLDVQEGEVGSSSFLVEGAALNQIKTTILTVSSFRNCSKSRAAPWVES